MNKRQKYKSLKTGFTLIEVLVVVSIIALLSSVLMLSVADARERARYTVALSNQRQLQKAAELYYNDMGFYPPDVRRGWDPGFEKPMPVSEDGSINCNINFSPCECNDPNYYVSCDALPGNWAAEVTAKWKGPYVTWPKKTPWGGYYDYNNWPLTGQFRNGCWVQKGLYIEIMPTLSWQYGISQKAEEWFLQAKLDADNCINGESSLALFQL